MAEVLAVKSPTRVPGPADHVALRALMKYMSGILSVPYKTISSGTKFDESSVKNYTNDKSSRSLRAAEMYAAFSDRCAEIILERKRDLHLDGYVLSLLQHLFGEEFLRSAGLGRPAVELRAEIEAHFLRQLAGLGRQGFEAFGELRLLRPLDLHFFLHSFRLFRCMPFLDFGHLQLPRQALFFRQRHLVAARQLGQLLL